MCIKEYLDSQIHFSHSWIEQWNNKIPCFISYIFFNLKHVLTSREFLTDCQLTENPLVASTVLTRVILTSFFGKNKIIFLFFTDYLVNASS